MKILFQGDSITDANRFNDLENLGYGYVRLVKEELNSDVIINRGISGDRTNEVLKRYHKDICLIDFDVIFILLGINDVWHHFALNNKTNINTIKSNYEQILKNIKNDKPNAQIVLITPFAYPSNIFLKEWFSFLNEVKEEIVNLSKKYQSYLIEMQEVLDNNLNDFSELEILHDGVHPTSFGHNIIKTEIIKVIKTIKKTSIGSF